MMKRKYQPTSQDLHRARKEREEKEKYAELPPGFINHGNTCFMNSTLQGLLATGLLHDLVRFQPLPPYLQSAFGTTVLARRSPQLTNGHGLGGEYERPWVDGMPLGDAFIDVMRKAWDIREGRTRQTMSPKEVLFTIGKKYEQYLDFRQQDAHEFLRHTLDAMRMEELDIIKKRQPPPAKGRRSRRKHTLPLVTTASDTAVPAGEEQLKSFVDMLFGGHLASILVCEKCKKVSLTYEEFNDLSLSIKPEDYGKDRKRDKLKKFAKKLRGPFRQPGSGPRSSSMPPDRLRRSMEMPAYEEEPPTNEGPRRKSFDHTTGEDGEQGEALDEVRELAPQLVSAMEDAGTEAGDEKDEPDLTPGLDEAKKDRADPWGRLGRRLSVSVRKALDPGSPSRSVERGRKVHNKDKGKGEDMERTPARGQEPRAVRTSLASTGSAYDSGSDAGDLSDAARTHLGSSSPTPSPLSHPPITATSTSSRPRHIYRLTGITNKRRKSLRAPKPSREEQAYLRQLLSDVHVASNNPFSALHQVIANGQTHSAAAQAAWTKIGHLPGIEECLRMFTAVEILDDENMVGCHRCWKIAHGLYKPKRHSDPREDGDASDEEDDDSGNSGGSNKTDDLDSLRAEKSTTNPSAEIFSSSPGFSATGRVSPASTSALHSTHSVSSLSDVLPDSSSIASAPTTVSTGLLLSDEGVNGRSPTAVVDSTKPATYGGLPIPSISTTAPESTASPSSLLTHETTPDGGGTPRKPPGNLAEGNLSDDDLLTPRGRRRFRAPNGADTESETSVSDYESDSDISASTSAFSDATSAVPSPAASPQASAEDLPTARHADMRRTEQENARPPSSRTSKPKQVILRRMYKRYLIADAPPVLVIHLKRFQQTSKSYSIPFSGASGVKKLDEYVAFPEYLDIGAFLAPRREDFGLDDDGRTKAKYTDKERRRCMYRLYAVVVHIGNMLGGHYIAYTALSPHSVPSPSATPGTLETLSSAQVAPSNTSEHGEKTQEHTKRQWAYISDTIVRLTTIEEVLKTKAYICMYERV